MIDTYFEAWWQAYSGGTATDGDRAVAWRAWVASKQSLLFRQSQEKKNGVQSIV